MDHVGSIIVEHETYGIKIAKKRYQTAPAARTMNPLNGIFDFRNFPGFLGNNNTADMIHAQRNQFFSIGRCLHLVNLD